MKGLNLAIVAITIGVITCFWLIFNPGTTQIQKTRIGQIVHDYLIENPEVLTKAVTELTKREKGKRLAQAQSAIIANKDKLLSTNSPILGNPNGNTVLIKFLDYQCTHCKRMENVITELIQENPNLKVIIKELPIFGGASKFAAKAALAAEKQGKFEQFHQALLQEKGKLTEDKVLNIAKDNGLDIDVIKKDMEAQVVDDELSEVLELAKEMYIKGTPYFVVMSDPFTADDQAFILSGAVPQSALQQQIDQINQQQ